MASSRKKPPPKMPLGGPVETVLVEMAGVVDEADGRIAVPDRLLLSRGIGSTSLLSKLGGNVGEMNGRLESSLRARSSSVRRLAGPCSLSLTGPWVLAGSSSVSESCPLSDSCSVAYWEIRAWFESPSMSWSWSWSWSFSSGAEFSSAALILCLRPRVVPRPRLRPRPVLVLVLAWPRPSRPRAWRRSVPWAALTGVTVGSGAVSADALVAAWALECRVTLFSMTVVFGS